LSNYIYYLLITPCGAWALSKAACQLPDLPTNISNARRSFSANKQQPEAINREDNRTQHDMGRLLQIAKNEIGQAEIVDKKHNPRILQYHQ